MHTFSRQEEAILQLRSANIIDSCRRGHSPSHLLAVLKRHGRPSPRFLEPIERLLEKFTQLVLRPGSGYFRIDDEELRRKVAALPAVAPHIETATGPYLLLKPSADLAEIDTHLRNLGYLLQDPFA